MLENKIYTLSELKEARKVMAPNRLSAKVLLRMMLKIT